MNVKFSLPQTAKTPFTKHLNRYAVALLWSVLVFPGLAAQITQDTISLTLDYPECGEGTVDDVSCRQLGDLFISELKAFYLPVLDKQDRKNRLLLFAQVRNQAQEKDNLGGPSNPRPAKLSLLKLSRESVSVKLSNLWNEQTEISVNLKRKSKDPRKDVKRLAREAMREIIWRKDSVRMGTPVTLHIRGSANENLTFLNAKEEGRREVLELSGTENYASLPAKVGEQRYNVIPTDRIRSPTYANWSVRNVDGKYRLRPQRLVVGASAALAFPGEEPTGSSSGWLAFELLPRVFIRGGGSYFVLPVSTTVSPFGGASASPRAYRTGKLVPFVGLGYELRDTQTGVIFSGVADVFPSPRLVRFSAGVALEKLPWLKLQIAWQSLEVEVENRTFSSSSPVATSSTTPRAYNFPTIGLGLNFTL